MASIFNLFSGPSAEKLEQQGDALFEARAWGQAKQKYERALEKLEKRSAPDAADMQKIFEKIQMTREALAREHLQNAENFAENGYFVEARNLISLALELTAEAGFKEELAGQLRRIELMQIRQTDEALPDRLDASEEEGAEQAAGDEYFLALCGSLPEQARDAYLQYGEDFRAGYCALNLGDFQTAAEALLRAMEQNPQPDSYVPLELAAAYLNLDRLHEAQLLLEGFLKQHPEALPGYQLLCEIFWEQKDFQQADALLAAVPDEFSESLAVSLLKGETLCRAGKYHEARNYYSRFLKDYGWNQTVSRELAKICEMIGELDAARGIYKEILGRYKSCRAGIDPEIKHRYAELCFAAGAHDDDILELYLSLAREVPDRAAQYFDRISRIYAARGNAREAARFRAFSIKADGKNSTGS
jgi:tetratricopeptide (TPR) repeat protein